MLTYAEIEAIRGRSRAGKNGPWVTDWNAMAKKTVVKQLEVAAAVGRVQQRRGDGRAVRVDATRPLVDVQPDFIDGEGRPGRDRE